MTPEEETKLKADVAALDGKLNTILTGLEAQRAKQMTAYWRWIESLPSKHTAAGYGILIGIATLGIAEFAAYFIGYALKAL